MTFLTDDFLLSNEPARQLYHDIAKHQPIFDYHCHLCPRVIAENKPFANLAEVWLSGDHYKWRGLRTLGVAERLITGNATPREKFQAYAESVPHFLGNPLYHWTHLELKRPFGIDNIVLNAKTAESVWQMTNELLLQPEFSPRGILKQMKVRFIGTTDDPCDDLAYHKKIALDSHSTEDSTVVVRPSFRPDKAIKIEHEGFIDYLTQLSAVSDIAVEDFTTLCTVLSSRLEYFVSHGCLTADQGLEILRYADIPDEATLNTIVKQRLHGKKLNDKSVAQFYTALLVF
ncbi:MAG: glucuronate isomerase, partial [Ostreibacterium sp.]